MIGIFGKKGVDHWIEKGGEYNRSGKFEKAIECFDKALEIDPRNAVAWRDKGLAYDHLRDFKKGMECYDKSLEIDPNNHLAWHNKAYALFERSKKYEEALEHVKKALEIHPNFLESLFLQLRVLRELREHQKALECCNKILSIDPLHLAICAHKGDLLTELGKAEEAKYWNEKSTRQGKPGEAIKLNIEAGKYRLGDSRALECLNKALELDPKDAGIWHNKGICHLNRREFQEALKALDKALEIAPNWVVALNHRRLAYEKCMHV